MRCLFIFMLTVVLLLPVLSAQEMEPKDEDLILPEQKIELEDLSHELIETPLPDLAYLPPSLTLLLPDAVDLQIADDFFVMPQLVGETKISGATTSNFYSEGLIGVGSMLHIIGSITLYRLEAEPGFRLHFLHEGLDGFGLRDAGEGFFERTDLLEGDFSLTRDLFLFSFKTAYAENETGLQNRSALYTSVTNRSAFFDLLFSFGISEWFAVKTMFNASFAGHVLSGSDAAAMTEYHLEPELRLEFYTDILSVYFSLRYEFENIVESDQSASHRFLGELIALLDPGLNFQFAGSFGVLVDFSENSHITLYYPFSLKLSGVVGEFLAITVTGGFKAEKQNYFALWNTQIFAAAGAPLPLLRQWYGKTEIKGLLFPGFRLIAALDYRYSYQLTFLNKNPDLQTGQFAVLGADRQSLITNCGFDWDISENTLLKFSWELNLLDLSAFLPVHNFNIYLDISGKENRYGFFTEINLPVYSDVVYPFVNLGGFVRITGGIKFSLEFLDILTPFFDTPHYLWGPDVGSYESPGFRMVLKTYISL